MSTNKLSKINIESIIKTKIVCTLGPAVESSEVLEKLILAGMDVVRLNFSHGSYEEFETLFTRVRELSKKYDEQVSILCDIQGPKLRTGKMKEPFELSVGDEIRVTSEEIVGDKSRIYVSYPHLTKDLKKDDLLYINDGIVRLRVTQVDGKDLVCVTEAPGKVSDKKGVNIPKGNLSIDLPTEKDKKDLAFIAKLNPEFVAASFIETAKDVNDVRACLKANGNESIKIISKIERPEALKHLDEIIAASDAIMVARGDLGVEIPPEQVPVAQKDMVRRCNRAGKTVIVATQMLESMTESSRPTRAEASDVFNAVLDGADAVMLSAETSVGKYPVEAVKYMDTIIGTAEKYLQNKDPDFYDDATQPTLDQTMGNATYHAAQHMISGKKSGKIICLTKDGQNVQMISKYRPAIPILAFTTNLRAARELNMTWGTRTVYSENIEGEGLEEKAATIVKKAFEMQLLKKEESVIVIADSISQKVKHGAWMGIYDVSEIVQQ